MSHPRNKHERVEIGKKKGKRRSNPMTTGPFPDYWDENKKREWIEKHRTGVVEYS